MLDTFTFVFQSFRKDRSVRAEQVSRRFHRYYLRTLSNRRRHANPIQSICNDATNNDLSDIGIGNTGPAEKPDSVNISCNGVNVTFPCRIPEVK
jgi:hypothetical protein